MSFDRAALDLGWSREGFSKAFAEVLSRVGPKALCWDEKNLLIYFPNWLRYNPPSNPNIVKSWRTVLDDLPEDSPLINKWLRITEHRLKGFKKPFGKAFDECFGEGYRHQEQEQEQEQEQDGKDTQQTTPAPEKMTWKLERLFKVKFTDKMGSPPPKVINQTTLEDIEEQLNHHRTEDMTDDEYLHMAGGCVDTFLAMDEEKASKDGDKYPIWLFKRYLPSILSKRKEPTAKERADKDQEKIHQMIGIGNHGHDTTT
jgi:hypothetical protein